MIPAGQDELLRRMLDPPEGLPEGWQFTRATIEGAAVEAEYKSGETVVTMRLVHRDAAHDGALRTESFAIEDALALPDELARAVEISLLAREHRIQWVDVEASRPPPPVAPEPRVDPEWCALESGVSRVLRFRVDAQHLPDVERTYRERGAHVTLLEPESESAGALLFVARDEKDASAAADIERALRREGVDLGARRHRLEELGWALGFPSCCVTAFVERAHEVAAGKGRFRDQLLERAALALEGTQRSMLRAVGSLVSKRIGTEAYVAAREAWVREPLPRLNQFLGPIGRSLIGFEPCRYDCPVALAYANRVAEACAAIDAKWLAETERRLAEPVVIAPTGAWAIVHLERRVEPMRIVGARPMRARGREPAATDAELATELIGAETRDEGFLSNAGTAWCLLIDFGWQAGRVRR